MPKFSYKVKDQQGQTIKGEVEAVTKDLAIKLLRNKQYVVVGIEEEKAIELEILSSLWGRISADDLVNFTRQLSTMIAAGLPLTEALVILRVQSSAPMGRVVTKVLQEVEGGQPLAEALKRSGKVFPPIYIALVKAGEAAGVLDQVLKRLATTMEKQRDFRNKTKGALVYPAIVMVGMVLVAAVMMIFVVPKMTQMYKDFGAELPFATRALIGVSGFMVKWWYVLAIVLGVGIYFFQKWVRTEVGGLMIEKAIFKLPIIGILKTKIVLTEFTRTMSLLIASGITILEALRIVADSVGSKVFEQRILETAERVEKGQSLGAVLSGTEEFPPIVSQMVTVGEQTGKVDEILGKLADYFEQESELAVKTMTTAIEPLILVIMGIGVGFLVMAVIMPIYNLTSQF